MKTVTKISLIIAAVLTVVGGLIFTLALALEGWDIKKISTDKFETRTLEIYDNFENILVDIDTADIKFLPGETENTQILLKEYKNEKHTTDVTDKTLKITLTDKRHWTDYISFFSFESPKITVYLPKEEYLSLKIDTDTSDIEIPKNFKFQDINIKGSTADVKSEAMVKGDINITLSTGDITLSEIMAQNLNLKVSTGEVTLSKIATENLNLTVTTGDSNLKDISCTNLISNGDTGDMVLNNVIAYCIFNIKRNTGDINFDSCDASQVSIKTTTGDVIGTFETSKVFLCASDTGRIDVPKSTEGGKCEITTDTGDITIKIE